MKKGDYLLSTQTLQYWEVVTISNHDKIINKIKKLKAIANNIGATEHEKDTAQRLLEMLSDKYKVNISNLDIGDLIEFKIIPNDDIHRDLLIDILSSYDIESYRYVGKGKRKNNVYFKTTQNMYDLIKYELEFHYKNLSEVVKGLQIAYTYEFISKPKEEITYCINCSYCGTDNKCYCSTGRHFEDVSDSEGCEMYQTRKTSKDSEEDYNLRQGIKAGFNIFLGAERRYTPSSKRALKENI